MTDGFSRWTGFAQLLQLLALVFLEEKAAEREVFGGFSGVVGFSLGLVFDFGSPVGLTRPPLFLLVFF